MEQATVEVAATVPDTIEFGGLVWKLDNLTNGGIQYKAYQPHVGEYRVYQYPVDGNNCAGQWLWAARLGALTHPMPRPSHLDMDCSSIVPSMEEAMQCCLDAKTHFVNDVIRLASYLGSDKKGDYEAGFFDGVNVGKEEAIRAIKESLQ